MTNQRKKSSYVWCCSYSAALSDSSLLSSKEGTFFVETCLFSILCEGNCWVWFSFVLIAALYNEKVGVNERKRKRRTTIR